MPSVPEFPDHRLADENGLLAYGGNLEVETLLTAYSKGIFPWYNEGSPILWWSPDPRMVLFPENFRVSQSLGRKIRKGELTAEFDSRFQEVIRNCAGLRRRGQKGTWITSRMQEAYINLHIAGYAHSVETYYQGKLAGGLYGVAIGRAFFGESMFYLVPDASKVALYHLVQKLKKLDFELIDVQQSTAHLRSLGAEEIPRKAFLTLLKKAVTAGRRPGPWNKDINSR